MAAARVDRRRWGDEDPEDEDFLPPTEETDVDDHGIKLRIEYYRNDKGQAIKKTTKIRVASVQQKVYKADNSSCPARTWTIRIGVDISDSSRVGEVWGSSSKCREHDGCVE